MRKLALPNDFVTTVAGSCAGGEAGKGFGDREGTAIRFRCPSGV